MLKLNSVLVLIVVLAVGQQLVNGSVAWTKADPSKCAITPGDAKKLEVIVTPGGPYPASDKPKEFHLKVGSFAYNVSAFMMKDEVWYEFTHAGKGDTVKNSSTIDIEAGTLKLNSQLKHEQPKTMAGDADKFWSSSGGKTAIALELSGDVPDGFVLTSESGATECSEEPIEDPDAGAATASLSVALIGGAIFRLACAFRFSCFARYGHQLPCHGRLARAGYTVDVAIGSAVFEFDSPGRALLEFS